MDQRLNFKIRDKVPQGAGGRCVDTRMMCVRKDPSTGDAEKLAAARARGAAIGDQSRVPAARAQPCHLRPVDCAGSAALSPSSVSVPSRCAWRSLSASCFPAGRRHQPEPPPRTGAAAPVHEELHPAGGLRGQRAAAHDPRPAGRPVHLVPHHPYQDRPALVSGLLAIWATPGTRVSRAQGNLKRDPSLGVLGHPRRVCRVSRRRRSPVCFAAMLLVRGACVAPGQAHREARLPSRKEEAVTGNRSCVLCQG